MAARFLGCVFLLVGVLSWAKADSQAIGTKGAVATGHPLASQVAKEIIAKGGNAVDAAVAAGLMLGVVDGFNSGIGGGCFLLIRKANGEVIAIDGRETAPAAAARDMFLRDGKAVAALSQTGPLAVGVPGAVAAYDMALHEHGRLGWKDVAEPAARVAEEGFKVTAGYASRIASVADDLRKFPAAAAILLPSGSPLKEGELLQQADLARTYRSLAAQGREAFYRRDFAKRTAAWMHEHGGLITEEDLGQYRAIRREAIRSHYRGHTILGFPPPSSGGVHVAQILGILEGFELRRLSEGQRAHVIAEAMRFAFADRAFWLGDPDFAKVPRGLISPDYAAGLAKKIDLGKRTDVTEHGMPPDAASHLFGQKHTTHFCVADAEGNWVACTATINTSFGSKIVVPGTGVFLNNEMDDFAAQPGVPNFFGLLGSEANAVAPGKRPLSSMSPTIVLDPQGQPVFSVGAAGGPMIITASALAVINRLDFGRDATDALAQPRLHHQWRPDRLLLERRAPDSLAEDLARWGHKVERAEAIAIAQAIGRRPDGTFEAATDPRGYGTALAW